MRASHRVPPEVRRMIIEAAVDNGYNLGNLASVSREWQAIIEWRNFQRLKITTDRICDLNEMTQRHRHHVRYLWLCIELPTYDDHDANDPAYVDHRASPHTYKDYNIILWSMKQMFLALSAWDSTASDGLTLDISIHSPSDKGIWFKYLTFEPDADIVPVQDTIYEPYVPGPEFSISSNDRHERYDVSKVCRRVPPRYALERVFQRINGRPLLETSTGQDFYWVGEEWNQLPQAPVVTRLLLRQQTRRRWQPDTILAILGSLPELEEFHYEPWREFVNYLQWRQDGLYSLLLKSNHLRKLKRLTIFENFDPLYPLGYHSCSCHRPRVIDQGLCEDLIDVSFGLETLSGAFMFEASSFFIFATDEILEHRGWPKLKSLHLTSNFLKPSVDKDIIMLMLGDAARVATHMPQLTTLEIWNGDRELATSFKFEFSHTNNTARITWTGTWDLPMSAQLIEAWEKVAAKRGSTRKIELVNKIFDSTRIKCHGDAILQLDLSGTVARPVSVKQIREKNNFPPVEWEL